MVHYPFIYLYYAWVKNGDLSFSESLPGALAVVIGSILLAWLCLKFYDEPVRSFLAKHFLKRKITAALSLHLPYSKKDGRLKAARLNANQCSCCRLIRTAASSVTVHQSRAGHDRYLRLPHAWTVCVMTTFS